ncbi:unnamed protein product [Aureobasidium vineae]|uniref:Uncharacterized protein n=1 Tax=Aureobasidium vineae TaxID=2773715 RepID=A0A9N8J7V6_9PEZI|nr:unnamed protein product [Aureobasidium vineae]
METPSSLDRILRNTTIITFLLALALLIPYSLVSYYCVLAIGLVPAFFSAVLSLVSLNASFRQRWMFVYIDAFLAVFLFSILVPFWVLTAHEGWSTPSGVVMLGTYGSVPLMMDFCIHGFFVLRYVFGICRTFSFTRTCRNCHTHIGARIVPSITRVSAEKSRHSRESEALYQPLDGPKYDDEERVSSEADTLYRPSLDTLSSTETVVKLI